MRRHLPPIHFVALALAIVGSSARAQEPKLRQWAKANQNFGRDDTTLRRFFAAILAERRPAAPTATTLEQLADQVTNVRVFATGQAGMVVGEIVTTGKTSLKPGAFPRLSYWWRPAPL